MPFYVIRHGETILNQSQVMQGHLDSSLSQKGFDQARQMAQSFKGISFSLVGASPLERAQQTASLISKELNVPMQTFHELKARGYGPWEGKTIPQIRQEYKDVFEQMKRWSLAEIFSKSPLPRIETYEEVSQRALKLFHKYADKDENILFVAHTGVISAILIALGLPSSEVPLLSHMGHVQISSTKSGLKIQHIEGLIDTKKFVEKESGERCFIF